MFTRSMGLRACTLALALAAAAMPARPQAPTGEIELETWRAAARLDTADAYRAYLAQYPNGAFARFAQLALAKLGGPAPAAAAPAPSTLPAATVELDTNIVDLRVGERLNGPGVISVGSIGSRRHVLLPRGEWVVLTGFDHRSPDRIPVPMVTLGFGQFHGTQLSSVLAVSFNRRTVAPASGGQSTIVAMGTLPTWTAAEQCEAPSPLLLHHAVVAGRQLKRCEAMRRLADGDDAWAGTGALRAGVDAALQLLKAQAVPLRLRSELHLTDNRYGYMAYTRLDAAADANERATWLKAFGPLAASAYERELEIDELRAGQPASASAAQLALPF